MAGPQSELDIESAEQHREISIFVFGINEKDLDAASDSAHRQLRQQVRLAGSRVADEGDQLAGLGLETDIVEGRRLLVFAVAKADVIKDDLSTHLREALSERPLTLPRPKDESLVKKS